MGKETPGYKTTEFWFSLISVAVILLKLVGIDVSLEDQQALATSIAGLVAGLLAVWGIVSRYIKSRSEIKQAIIYKEVTAEAAKSGQPVTFNFGGK